MSEPELRGPFRGLRVIDLATLYAGPLAAMLLADFGAETLKLEHPRGDSIRRVGPSKAGRTGRPVGLAAKLLNRNKYCATLDLAQSEGQDLLLDLVEHADVLIEGFRPGTLERWNLGPDRLLDRNSQLIIARVSGFGQLGPHAGRPGFGTLAEALSGFAAMTGPPTEPGTLPPIPLADSVAGIATAFAVSAAVQARQLTGRGQVVDLAIIEPMLTLLGPQLTWYQQLGEVPERRGNRSAHAAPRNMYRTRDRRWVAVSATSQSVAERLMTLIGRADLAAAPWFATGAGRLEHEDELDAAVAQWLAGHDFEEADARFAEAGAAIAPLLNVSEIAEHPQYRALESVVELEDAELGPVAMQNLLFRLSDTPGSLRWTGPELGAHNELVYGRLLGRSEAELAQLRERGVI
ncbi:MAG: CoA transferase [Enhygromyxa sp.]